jgi:hypothetical protein
MNKNNRFNGATASLPWKSTESIAGGFVVAQWRVPWPRRRHSIRASMGPRHHCRGNMNLPLHNAGTGLIRFNGATASLPWKSCRC